MAVFTNLCSRRVTDAKCSRKLRQLFVLSRFLTRVARDSARSSLRVTFGWLLHLSRGVCIGGTNCIGGANQGTGTSCSSADKSQTYERDEALGCRSDQRCDPGNLHLFCCHQRSKTGSGIHERGDSRRFFLDPFGSCSIYSAIRFNSTCHSDVVCNLEWLASSQSGRVAVAKNSSHQSREMGNRIWLVIGSCFVVSRHRRSFCPSANASELMAFASPAVSPRQSVTLRCHPHLKGCRCFEHRYARKH